LRSGAGASQLVLVKSPEVTALIREVVFDVACQAKAHLDHARGMQKLVPPAARAALLPAVCVDRFLRRLEAQNFDIFSGGWSGCVVRWPTICSSLASERNASLHCDK
jgi:hypothetical protein